MPVPLDPITATLFFAAFAFAAVLTVRRPAYGLCLLIAATPFELPREVFATTMTLPKAVLLGILLGLCSFPSCVARLRERPALLLVVLLAAYAAAVGFSIVHAEYRGPVVRETLKWVEYALTFAAAFLCRRLDDDDASLVATMSIVAILVAVTALAQIALGAPSGLHAGTAIVPRISGALEGPNQLAGYLAIMTAALGAWTLVGRRRLLDGALAVMACAGMLTFSRGWLLEVAVVAAIFILFAGPSAARALIAPAGGLAAGAAVIGWWAIQAHSLELLRFSSAGSAYAGGVGDRGALWRAALAMWRRHPIAGVGAGNFETMLPKYGIFGVRTHANSWYLSSLAEGGIVLLAATLALVLGTLKAFARGLRRTGETPWALASMAAASALAVHQVFDYLVFYPKVGGAWWLLAGLGAAALATREHP